MSSKSNKKKSINNDNKEISVVYNTPPPAKNNRTNKPSKTYLREKKEKIPISKHSHSRKSLSLYNLLKEKIFTRSRTRVRNKIKSKTGKNKGKTGKRKTLHIGGG